MTHPSPQSSLELALEAGFEWVLAHAKTLAVLAVVLLLSFIAVMIYKQREADREAAFASAFYTDIVAKDLKDEARLSALTDLEKRFGNVKSVRFAGLDALRVLALQKKWGELEQKSKQLAERESDIHLKTALLFSALHAAENQKAYDRALAGIDELLAISAHSEYLPLVQAEKGRLLIASGKRDEGRTLLQGLLKSTDKPLSAALRSWIEDLLIGSTHYGTP